MNLKSFIWVYESRWLFVTHLVNADVYKGKRRKKKKKKRKKKEKERKKSFHLRKGDASLNLIEILSFISSFYVRSVFAKVDNFAQMQQYYTKIRQIYQSNKNKKLIEPSRDATNSLWLQNKLFPVSGNRFPLGHTYPFN